MHINNRTNLVAKCLFIAFVVASRFATHLGYFGLNLDRIFFSIILIFFSIALAIRVTPTIKWLAFITLLIPYAFALKAAGEIFANDESISVSSWISLGFWGGALMILLALKADPAKVNRHHGAHGGSD